VAQRKWELKEKDAGIAYLYIMRNIKDYKMFEHRDNDIYFEAQREFEKIKDIGPENDNFFSALKNWIEKYLDEIQIKKLRTKIRVEKSRWKKDLKQITIDSYTHHRLSQYAKRYNITLSKAIEKLLDLAEEQDKQGKLFE